MHVCVHMYHTSLLLLIGIAYRSCNDDGTWSETVNVTECFSEEFAQIEDMVCSCVCCHSLLQSIERHTHTWLTCKNAGLE